MKKKDRIREREYRGRLESLLKSAQNGHAPRLSAITRLNGQATAFNLLSASGLVKSRRLRVPGST